MPDVSVVQGDTGWSIGYRLMVPDESGERLVPLDLSPDKVESVRLRMYPAGCPTGPLGGGPVTVVGPPVEGLVRYNGQAPDTRRPGLYWFNFECKLVGSGPKTIPEDRYLTFRVMQRLGPAIP